ncbi:putative ABC transporter permease [Paenibacillus sp. MMS20-IR301]|uniref:putative ABC transporter permease n=1 Tax=Paenibacillus sp. MMS20-IR301 TaxID=2895946 RepID=UPI0028E21402|nr:putative ABC transporter permease [Paenibacillus sp. MMS20-IR301]WNS45931.1 putative ABC transporter permease [Paenibacillus sp. MMS20-IR301]
MTPVLLQNSYSVVTAAGPYFFYFTVYSFLGWVLEGSYNLYSEGSFRKEGFLKGPFKPMYGFAPLLLLAAHDAQLVYPVFLLLALLIPSAVEFVSGWLLKSLFQKQWWDYSGMPYQLKGHICLKFSLYWWGLSIACIYLLQPLMHLLYLLIEPVWLLLLPGVMLLSAADLLWTCRSRRRGLKQAEPLERLELGEG